MGILENPLTSQLKKRTKDTRKENRQLSNCTFCSLFSIRSCLHSVAFVAMTLTKDILDIGFYKLQLAFIKLPL